MLKSQRKTEKTQQREGPTEAEVELLERFGPGAAVGFL
jgi:hypothetical protein